MSTFWLLIPKKKIDHSATSTKDGLMQHCIREEWSRDPLRTESIASGSKGFIEETKEKMGFKAKGRQIHGNEDKYSLRGLENSYTSTFDIKKCCIRTKNTFF